MTVRDVGSSMPLPIIENLNRCREEFIKWSRTNVPNCIGKILTLLIELQKLNEKVLNEECIVKIKGIIEKIERL